MIGQETLHVLPPGRNHPPVHSLPPSLYLSSLHSKAETKVNSKLMVKGSFFFTDINNSIINNGKEWHHW